MRAEYREMYAEKYSSPFACYLDSILDGGPEGSWGDTDGPGLLVHVEGRHFLYYSEMGFVYEFKSDRGQEVDDFVRDNFPAQWDWEQYEED